MNEPQDRREPLPPKQDPEALVLRGRPRPVVRFRRGLIVGVTGAVAVGLTTLSWLALQPPTLRKTAPVINGEESSYFATPEAVAGAPKTYGDVPRLGPPLPGDLGRPILEHERSVATGERARISARSKWGAMAGSGDERERLAEAAASARSSAVLVPLGRGQGSQAIIAAAGEQAQVSSADDIRLLSSAGGAGQQHKVEFAHLSEGEVNPGSLERARSPYKLSAGTIIAASLITGINSDLPGMVMAQVTENVRDSVTGTQTLIPQGSRLIGRYDSMVTFGQKRALLVWTRIVFPDASSIDLGNLPGADVSGYAGLRDQVDSHSWQLLKGIALSTLLGVGTQLSLGNRGDDLVRAIRESAQQSASNAGTQITGHELDVQPTITIRPGWPVRAILNRDVILRPWLG